MKIHTVVIAAASLLAFASLAKADDHLVNALDHGLKAGSQPFQDNPAGHSGYRNVDTVECRGSTYTFEATRRGRDVIVFVNSRNGALWRR